MVLTLIVATLILSVIVLIPIGTIVTNYLTQRDRATARQATKLGKPAEPGETPRTGRRDHDARDDAGGRARRCAQDGRAARHGSASGSCSGRSARYGLALHVHVLGGRADLPLRPEREAASSASSRPGAVFTVGVWLLLGVAFRVYVDRFGKYGETYGAVGGVIILLFFFYLDALVLLVGAEINCELDCRAMRAMRAANEEKAARRRRKWSETEPATNTP